MRKILTILLLLTNTATAQDFFEGTAGSIDKKRRAPVISVGPVARNGGISLEVDAYVPDTTFEETPLQFDFYINRRLIATQIRSKEQPGPVGIDVGSEIASPPFDYTVTATVLHTNRQYVSVAEGSVYAQNYSGTFSCTVGETATDASREFAGEDVKFIQTGANTLSFDFKTSASTDGEDRKVKGLFNIVAQGETASGTLLIDSRDEFTASGKAFITDATGVLGSLEISTNTVDGKSYTLDCINNNGDSGPKTEEFSGENVTSSDSEEFVDNTESALVDALISGKKK